MFSQSDRNSLIQVSVEKSNYAYVYQIVILMRRQKIVRVLVNSLQVISTKRGNPPLAWERRRLAFPIPCVMEGGLDFATGLHEREKMIEAIVLGFFPQCKTISR